MAESETVFDVDATFHSARDIQEFMETFCIDNGFKIHKHQYRNKEKEFYRGTSHRAYSQQCPQRSNPNHIKNPAQAEETRKKFDVVSQSALTIA